MSRKRLLKKIYRAYAVGIVQNDPRRPCDKLCELILSMFLLNRIRIHEDNITFERDDVADQFVMARPSTSYRCSLSQSASVRVLIVTTPLL